MINHDLIFDLDKNKLGVVPTYCSGEKLESNNEFQIR